MDLNYKYIGNELLVELHGEVDEYSCRTLRTKLDDLIDAPGLARVVFDMHGVSFVDSTGLGLILGRYKKLKARGAEMVLKRVPPQVDKVFRTSGIYTVAPKID